MMKKQPYEYRSPDGDPIRVATRIAVSGQPASEQIRPLREYIREMAAASSTSYSGRLALIDLRDTHYHGGSTLSSGALPKWDIEEIFIKACSLHPASGRWLMDSVYESYAMDLFAGTGARIACAYPAYALFFNTEYQKDELRLCAAGEKFAGFLTYYRDLRKTRKYGSVNDELIDFIDDFPEAKTGLLNMLAVDYIMNQTDRHSKNFGVLDTGELAPLYDNGCALYHTEDDERLRFVRADEVARVKFLARDSWLALSRYSEWLAAKPEMDYGIVLRNLDVIDEKYQGLLAADRRLHSRKIVEERVRKCREHFGS